MGTCFRRGEGSALRIYTYKALQEFWERHPDAKQALLAWRVEAKNADWASPTDVKERYPSASVLKGNRVVFNIRGNRYRLVVHINYHYRAVCIRFLGTHAEYDKVSAEEV